MIKFENNNSLVTDNSLVINSIKEYRLTDDEVLKVMSVIDGIISDRNVSTKVENTTKKPSTSKPSTPSKYSATKDFVAKYEVKKQLPKGSKTPMYCISRANGWTKSEKACMNDLIKALDGIKTIEVEYTDKNGKLRTFNAWGYSTKSKAEEMLATLPTTISADTLNARF